MPNPVLPHSNSGPIVEMLLVAIPTIIGTTWLWIRHRRSPVR